MPLDGGTFSFPGSFGNLLNPTNGLAGFRIRDKISYDSSITSDTERGGGAHADRSPRLEQYSESVLFLRCSANRFFQGFALLGFLTISISSSYGFAPGDSSSNERLIIRKTRGENENCLTTGDVDKEGNNASGT